MRGWFSANRRHTRPAVTGGSDPSGVPASASLTNDRRAQSAVYELVGKGEVTGGVGGLQAPHRRRGDDGVTAHLLQRQHVRPVVDEMGRDGVASAVTGEEGHRPSLEVAQGHRAGGGAEGCRHRYLLGGVEQLVQPGSTDDPDARRHGEILEGPQKPTELDVTHHRPVSRRSAAVAKR